MQKKNQKLVGKVAAVRNKLVGPGEARTKAKQKKPPRKLQRVLAHAFGKS